MSIAADLRCSSQARDAAVNPTGTAGSYDEFVLLEVPLPWPKEITEHAALAGITDVLPRRARVQGVVPAPDRVAEGRSLIVHHKRPTAWFTLYERRELVVASDAIVEGVTRVAVEPVATDDAVDLLVCTHGSRDRCCGALGMALFASVASRPGLRVKRTSHTGGHRFAPTAIVLPQGTAWAWLDQALLDAVLERTASPADLLAHYRGSTAMDTPQAQVAEAAVFAEVGWSWLEAARSAEVVEASGARSIVRLSSTLGAWEAEVALVGTIPQAVCGVAEPADPKRDQVFELRRLRSLP